MRIIELLKRRKRRFYKSLVLAFSVSLLTSLASYLGYLEGFEAKALHARQAKALKAAGVPPP